MHKKIINKYTNRQKSTKTLTGKYVGVIVDLQENIFGKLFLSEVVMRILNFGSLNIDYVYGVDHFVKKGETLSSNSLNVYSGGKGLNQSIAICRAGVKVYHAGAIGQDGFFLLDILNESGVDTELIKILPDTRTGNAIIQNDIQGDNCILLYSGANRAITRAMVDNIIDKFDAGDWLILQNEISEIPYIVEKAHDKKMKIIINPSPMDEKISDINLGYVDCLILNEVEAQGFVGEKKNDDEIVAGMREKFPDMEIVLTLGEKGSIYIGQNETIQQPAYKVQAIDTTAAGDTFTGYFLAARVNGMMVDKALDVASKASAIAVSRKGAAPSIPDKEEIAMFEKTMDDGISGSC